MFDRLRRKHEAGSPNGRDKLLLELSDPERQVYFFLKNRHIEHREYHSKKVTIPELETILDIEDGEKVVTQLIDEELVVRQDNDVMWMPKLSTELQTTLTKIQQKKPIDDDGRAKCLMEMGLVNSTASGGYRYRWEEDEADLIERTKDGTSNRSLAPDQQPPTVRAEIGVVLPKNCPVAETSKTVDTPIENISRAVTPVQNSEVIEEFRLESEISPGHPDLSEIASGVYRFSRDPRQDCVCDWIERFGCPVNDVRARDGTLIVSFTDTEPTVQEIVAELQERFSDIYIRQLAQNDGPVETMS